MHTVIGCDEISEQSGLVEVVLEFDVVVVVVENGIIQLLMMQQFSMLTTSRAPD